MNEEREKSILEIIVKEKNVTVKDLAKRLYASEPSIRRDLSNLEKQHFIYRTHGGARLEENGVSEIKIPFFIREHEKNDEKIKIAQKASSLVEDDSVIFLDASTSAYNMIPFLSEKKNLMVITNGIKALMKLSEYNIPCIGTGGKVINSCLAFVGENAHQTIERYNADYFFFSCRGVSNDGKLTDISEDENNVRKKMLCNSQKAYLLCTSNKKDKMFFNTLCSIDDITGVIQTDL